MLTLLSGCGARTKPDIELKTPCQCPSVTESPKEKSPSTEKPIPATEYPLLQPADWSVLSEFSDDNLSPAWNAWIVSCSKLLQKTAWHDVCVAAESLKTPSNAEIAAYFRQHFDVYTALKENGQSIGLITGYYEPELQGSRQPTARYRYPLYAQPNDLITVDLADLYPELKFKRIRGKLEGDKLKPYYSRAEIESRPSPLAGHEIVWVDDALEAFFLQIQGSGLVSLQDGNRIHLGYANQNGHPYQSIGKVLVQRGEMQLSQASMQGIKDWAKNHPEKLQALLNENPSYVFFKELPAGLSGPLGALGVPLTAERSIAIDPQYIPLGAPVFLSTTYPNSSQPFSRLMMAQDTGGAIKEGVRADLFWGSGETAGKMAGAMKQEGKMWVLLPKGFVFNPVTR